MRKLYVMLLLSLFLVTMASCSDKKLDDNRFNVIFYTGTKDAYVDTYFDVEAGTTIEEPEEPERPGFFFMGWYKEINFLNEWDFDTDVVNSSIIIYAKWNSAVWPLTFVVTEELFEEYVDPSAVPTEFTGDTRVYLPLVRRPGGSFKGWILVPPEQYTLDMTIYRYSTELPKLEYSEFTLYPIFTNNKYMVTFDPRMTGVSKPAPKTGIEYGSVVKWLPKISDTDTHRFVGWFTKNGSVSNDWGYQVEDGDYWTVAANALLYGRWESK